MADRQLAHARDYDGLAEAELVSLAKAGHREAFRVIMQRSNQRLFRVARAIVGDESEAEDVLQEAYARAFAKLSAFREEAQLTTWLSRIVINEARGRLRSRRPSVSVEEDMSGEVGGGEVIRLPSADPDPETAAARAQVRRILERAVDDLPAAFRLVFIMRDVEGCSIEETADQTGLRLETVKTRLHRARRLLRKALHEELALNLTGTFPFLGARCERITGAVLERLSGSGIIAP